MNNAARQTMTASQAQTILEVRPDATDEEIQSAYKKKIKEYHPDRVATLGEEIQQLAARKTVEINEAYSLLKNLR